MALLFREKECLSFTCSLRFRTHHRFVLCFFVFKTVLRCCVAVPVVIVTMQGLLKESERPASIHSLLLGLWIICSLQGRGCRSYVTTDASTFKGMGGFFPLIQMRRWMMIYYYCKR